MDGRAMDDFDVLRQEVFRLHAAQAHRQALELLEREGPHFDSQEARIAFWKMCFHSLLGEIEPALETMALAMEHGHWFGDSWLRSDPDLKALQGHPDFERMLAECQLRAREQAAQTQPSRLDLMPETDSTPPYPLVIALHGNNSSAQFSIDHWRPIAAQGCYLSLPNSSQLASSNTARWDDAEQAAQDVQHHYQELIAQQPVDAQRILMAGFSMGGRQALRLGLSGIIPARGIIALGPALGEEIKTWTAIFESAEQRQPHVYLIVGDQDDPDYIYKPVLRLADLLQQYAIPCRLHIYPGLEHDFPTDFAAVLPGILDWLLAD